MTLTSATDHRVWFSASEYARRSTLATEEVQRRGLDALVVTGPENITYLTGFESPGYHIFAAVVVPANGMPFHVMRDIEVDNARALSWVESVEEFPDTVDPATALADALDRHGLGTARIGLECDGFFVPVGLVDRIVEAMPGAEVVRVGGVLADARRVKSGEEVSLLRRAAAIADDTIRTAASAISSCATDSELAGVVLGHLARCGSEYTGSPAYVVAGPASAAPHSTHAMRPVEGRGNAWVELSASLGRYHAAASRVVVAGARDDDLDRVNAISVAALEAMLAEMGPGALAGDVDRAGRSLVAEAGYAEGWKHRAAYSLGVSFPPGLGEGHLMDIKPGDPRPLEAGMVFHLIPIIAVPELGSVGCTETVLVTDTGVESLSQLPREVLYAGAGA